MNRRHFLAGSAALAAAGRVRAAAARRPNVVFVLADDLGYGELGCYGQQRILTPHLDQLAADGCRLTQHYSGNAVCAPSRCVLQTGLHPGHAYIRTNREVRVNDEPGQLAIPADTVTLPRLLQAAGYATCCVGKWGLGGPGTTGEPLRQGFDHFFGYLDQAEAHNHYPTHLWDDGRKVALDNPPFKAHQRLPADADASDPRAYAGYAGRTYAPDLFAERAQRFVRESRDRPFFLCYTTTVPHLALQVPEDSLAAYRGRWDDPPYRGDRSYLPHPSPLAAYAAMVTRLDRDCGRLLALLDQLDLRRDTIVVFTSDNGPTHGRLGGTDSDFFASTAGLRGLKGSLYEGGIRVPAFVRWPGTVAAGSVADRVTGFEDWLPTLLDLAGLGANVPTGLDGLSFAATLRGEAQPARPFLYREFPSYGGQQSVRVGDWKAVRQNLLRRTAGQPPAVRTELYHLAADRAETTDLAASQPALVRQLEALLTAQHRPSAEFPLPALDR